MDLSTFNRWISVAGLGLFSGSQSALACSVCGFGKEGARSAFLFTTALLSVVPLLFIGGLCYYLFRKSQS